MRVCRFYGFEIPTVLASKCGHFLAYVDAMQALSAEEDLRALKVATNPHLLKKMRRLFDDLQREATYMSIPTTEPERTREQKFYDAVAAIEKARGKKHGV